VWRSKDASPRSILAWLAFLFSINKIPAGKAELPRQAGMLNLIQDKATK
jgi:hypothetical protein